MPPKAQLKLKKRDDKDDKKSIHELTMKIENLQETIERQNNTVIEILAQQNVLLSKILCQKNTIDTLKHIFPVKSVNKLRELDHLMQAHSDPYLQRMKILLKGNVGRYLDEILAPEIIYSFNVDGTHGKKSLKQFESFYTVFIDVIATITQEPVKALRKAFQLQKKKINKSKRVERLKNAQNDSSTI